MKLIIISVFLFASTLQAQSEFRFFINNINMPMDNKGIIGLVNIPPDGATGRFDGITFLFEGGFWLSGYNGDTLWMNAMSTAAQFENYLPGNVGSNQYDPRYKIYVVKESDPPFGPSWQEWIFAVEIGAEFYDGDNDGVYNPIDLNSNGVWDPEEDRPDIIGDQIAWCVYNDGVIPRIRFENVPPLGIEIHQTVFGYHTLNAPQLQNVLFIRYKIINTGIVNSRFDSVYFSAWTDPDLGFNYEDDLVGSDTLLHSGFVYNHLPTDSAFGSEIPSFFHTLLQGPQSYIPGETFIDNNSNGRYDEGIDTALDTAYNHKGQELGVENYPGAKNSMMTSYVNFVKSTQLFRTPENELEARYYMKGFTPDGLLIDPCNLPFTGELRGGVNCAEVNPFYWFFGDPVTDIGWINIIPADQRMLVSTGPFDLESDEPITIITAYIIGRGTDRLNSITIAREISAFTHQFFQSNFDYNILPVEEEKNLIVDEFKLFQNYPNPFNPTTKIKYAISAVASGFSLSVTIKVYDVLGNEITTLVNEEKPAGNYEVEFDASSLSSGVYFYQLSAGSFVETKKMILLR